MELTENVIRKATILFIEDYFSAGSVTHDTVPITPFHTALVDGDMATCQDILRSLTTRVKRRFLNTRILYSEEQDSTRCLHGNPLMNIGILTRVRHKMSSIELGCLENGGILNKCGVLLNACTHANIRSGSSDDFDVFRLPLSLAASSKNADLFRFMIHEGADVHGKDNAGNSIMHSLVILSDAHPRVAFKMVSILEESVPLMDRYGLMKAENADQKSPLDVAAELALPEMMLKIVNVEGVYRHVVKKCGVYKHIVYDVSEYESKQAEKRSIFNYFTEYDEAQLFRLDECRLLTTEPFRSWIDATLKGRFWHLLFWQLLWTIFIIFIFIDLYWKWNDNPLYAYSNKILFTIALFIILEKLVNLFINRKQVKNRILKILKGHHAVSMSSTYRMFRIVLAVTLVWSKSILIASVACQRHVIRVQFGAVLTTIFSVLSLLYFTQTQLRGGYVLIILGRMVYDTLMFFFVCFVIYMGFSLCFFYITVAPAEGSTCETMSGNITTGISPDFYESFLFMSLIMVPKDIYFTNSTVPSYGITLYVLSVIIIGIVMTNLLIALMTQSVQTIFEHKESLFLIEKLSAIMDLENQTRVLYLVPCLRRVCDKYMWRMSWRKRFLHDNDGTKAFIEVVENVVK